MTLPSAFLCMFLLTCMFHPNLQIDMFSDEMDALHEDVYQLTVKGWVDEGEEGDCEDREEWVNGLGSIKDLRKLIGDTEGVVESLSQVAASFTVRT